MEPKIKPNPVVTVVDKFLMSLSILLLGICSSAPGQTASYMAGTGLGLGITNDIIKAHGGMLELCSDENAGTCCVIQLPSAL